MPNPAYPFAPGLTIGNTPQVQTVNATDLQWVWQGGLLVAAQVQNVVSGKAPGGQFSLATSPATSTVVTIPGVTLNLTSRFKWWPAANSNLTLAISAANMMPEIGITAQSGSTITLAHPATALSLLYNYEVTP